MNIDLELRKYIDKKLLRRIIMLAAILLVMTGILIYEILFSDIHILFIIFGIIIGLIVGSIVGRIFSIEWHTESSKVVSRLDIVGGIILFIYIILSIFRHWIFAHWFEGITLSVFTFSFVEGVMVGRILSLRFSINKVLVEQGKL